MIYKSKTSALQQQSGMAQKQCLKDSETGSWGYSHLGQSCSLVL